MQSVIARDTRLPGANANASVSTEQYLKANGPQLTTVDAIVSVPISQIIRAGAGSRTFLVRAGGRAKAVVANSLTINLDAGDNAAFASNTTIFTTGSLALDADSTIGTWFIECELLLGTVDSKLQGIGRGFVNNTAVAQAVITESVEDLIAAGVLNFKVSATLTATNAGQQVFCDFLEVVAG